MSEVIRHTTQEQKDVINSIDIPNFMKNDNDYYLDDEEEISKAILNNIPGNSEIEEINHLNELEVVCQNWKEEEWKRVISHADSQLMCNELARRLKISETFIDNNKSNLDFLSTQYHRW